jgi:hypothetical protein
LFDEWTGFITLIASEITSFHADRFFPLKNGTLSGILNIETLRILKIENSGPITPKFDFSPAKNLEFFEIFEDAQTSMLHRSTLPTGKNFQLPNLQFLKILNVNFDPKRRTALFFEFPKLTTVYLNYERTFEQTVLDHLKAACTNIETFSVKFENKIA